MSQALCHPPTRSDERSFPSGVCQKYVSGAKSMCLGVCVDVCLKYVHYMETKLYIYKKPLSCARTHITSENECTPQAQNRP